MADINYDEVRSLLLRRFAEVERLHLDRRPPTIPPELERATDLVFRSNTQAYREVLLGCVLAKLTDPEINIRQPYLEHGGKAFSGRTLDERVVNPFLQNSEIPSSRGPYLSVFRRNVQFDASTRAGLRDKAGYDALLMILTFLETPSHDGGIENLLDYILYRFLALREEANIQIARLPRISLSQYEILIPTLLSIPSGGRIPVILVVGMLGTIAKTFGLDWKIEYAGINVADAAAGASGDITITSVRTSTMVLEVTERPVDANRVQSTFRTKIARSGIADYLFLVDRESVFPDAEKEAKKHFAQGYEVNFVDTRTWILMCLATMGTAGRSEYNQQLTDLFGAPDLPRTVKAGWNQAVLRLAVE